MRGTVVAMECMLIRCVDSKKATCESDATYCVCRGDLSTVLAKKKRKKLHCLACQESNYFTGRLTMQGCYIGLQF